MAASKKLRQGRILRLIGGEAIANQNDLRKRLAALGLRVTQATLSRDLRELRLVKTADGYRPLESHSKEVSAMPRLQQALREFLLDMRPAQNLLVLKAPPGGAQPLAIAVEAERWQEVAGTVAGDDTVLIITTSRKARENIQKRMELLLK